jgi:hypothetical protein
MKQIQKDVMHSSIVHRLNYRVSIPKITGNLRALSGSSEVLPLVHMRHFKCVLELTQNKLYQQLLKTVMQALKSAQNPSNSACWSTHFNNSSFNFDGPPTGTQEFNQYNQQPLVWTTEF